MKSTIILCFLAVLATDHCVDLVNARNFVKLTGSDERFIYILVVVDTDRLIKDFRRKSPSKDPDHPTPVKHTYAFMITDKKNVVSGQATGVLHIKCISGDIIKWYGVSESSNFDNQIIVYGIKHHSKSISEVDMYTVQRKNFFPVKNNIEDLELINTRTSVISVNAGKSGTVKYAVNCAIYLNITSPDTGNRLLFGHFTWDAMITVL